MRLSLSFWPLFALACACAAAGEPQQILCAGDNQCPTGQICLRGVCASPDTPRADGGAVTDAGQVTDAGSAVADAGLAPDGGGAEDAGTGADDGGADGGGGAFGAPCQTGAQCQSGICIQTSTGGVCTKLCSQDCPADWGCRLVNLTPVCVPPELTMCASCETDNDCGGAYRCTTYAGARVCLKSCGGPADCPGGQGCAAAEPAADGGVAVSDGGAETDGGTNGRCVPTEDLSHCGACGNACANETGMRCCSGQCINVLMSEPLCGTTCADAVACSGGLQCCGGSCVDTTTSDTHCGACLGEGGMTCSGADMKCCAGACVSTRDNASHCGSCAPCDASEACCGTQCADTSTSAQHCMGCGISCSEGQACCGTSGCQALADNDAHCGACGTNCATQIGAGGKCCGSACVNKLTDKDHCGDSCQKCGGAQPACCQGTCKDLTSVSSCGSCDTACSVGQSCCPGAGCVSTQTSAQHCGMCGNPCGPGETCCSGQCKNLTTDPNNCGACGTICSNNAWSNVASYGCSPSGCTIATCNGGFHDVDGQKTNGCECQQDGFEPNGFEANDFDAAHDVLDICQDELGDPCGGTASDDGYLVTINANLAPAADNDFYRLHVEDELFHNFEMRIKLTFNSSISLDLAVYKWNGSSWVAVAGTYNRTAGQVTFSKDSGETADFGFEVKRTASDLTCGAYTLELKDLF